MMLRFPCAALRIATLLWLVVLSGCATGTNPKDPYEAFNRRVYAFNETIDRYAVKPVAQGYRAVVPPPVRGGVTNVFSNFRDVTSALNSLLQFKLGKAASDVGRVVLNTTVGMFGIFDVAGHVGLDKHDEDFGQTLGVWGFGDGPYLVLPLFGPSTLRDSVGLIGDYFTDPEFYFINHSPETWIVFGVRLVNVRANLLEAERVFEQAAIDRYAFLRDAYLQRRRNQIFDGNPPDTEPGNNGAKRKTLRELEEELDLPPEESTPPPAKP
jgi:phospholipid-binding lipoprotein MlaA